MRNLAVILIFFIINSCNGQDHNSVTTYPKEKTMSSEQFNILDFKKYQAAQQSLPNGNPTERVTDKNATLITEYSMISAAKGTEYTREILPPAPALFYSMMIFYDNGKLKESVDKVFLGTLEFDYGLHSYYNEKGELTKTIDHSKRFDKAKIKLDDLFKILENESLKAGKYSVETEAEMKNKWFSENMTISPEMIINKIAKIFSETAEERGVFEKKFLNPNNRTDVQRLKINFDDQKLQWIVIKDFAVLGKVKLVIDANSGKILENSFQF